MNQNKISLIFIGTDGIGAPLLAALHLDDRFEVRLVVTQVDRPAGRKMELTEPPIKITSDELRITSFQPEDINSNESVARLQEEHPDLIVLMAYGQILKKAVLEVPKFGCINVHASILPKHRGASPIQQSLLHLDEMTGISVMKMVEKMDAGPVYHSFEIPIADEDNAETLREKLVELAAEKTPEVLSEIVLDNLMAEPQNHEKATYCQKIHKNDGHIDWSEPADQITAKVRAFAGWPGTFTFWNDKRLKVLSAKAYDYEGAEEAGEVFNQGNLVLVKCQRDALLLEALQMEGKTVQDISTFLRGYPDFSGSKLG